jgi:hypothetical protein
VQVGKILGATWSDGLLVPVTCARCELSELTRKFFEADTGGSVNRSTIPAGAVAVARYRRPESGD